MKCRKAMIILMLAVFLFSMAGAFAADDAAMAGGDASQLELSQSDDVETAADEDSGDADNIIGEGANSNSSSLKANEDVMTEANDEGEPSDVGNFTELASLFNKSEVVTLEKNYKAKSGEKAIDLNVQFNGFNIHVYGNNHTIDANGITSIFACDDDGMKSLVFEDINFINADVGNDFGGAISIGFSYIGQPVTAINCTFTNNKAVSGGALYSVIAINCTFNNNHADKDGGAMAVGAAINCTFTNNKAVSGGAMAGSTATDCTFTGNSAKISGGATDEVHATNCVFTNNSVVGDPLIFSSGGGAMNGGSAVNCVFTGNTVFNDGGAMTGGTAINCTFTDNKAGLGKGGALYESTAMNCTFTNNKAGDHGQAMYNGVEVLCHYEDGATHGTEHVTDILDVSDYKSAYNSGERVLFELKYNDVVFTGFKVTISVYQDGEFLDNYSALNDEGWAVPLKPGIYNATVSIDDYDVDSKDITITVDMGISNITVNVNDTVSLLVDDTAEIGAKLNNETVQLNYTSSNDTVASVDESGIITTHNVGEANITVSFDGNETYAPASKTVSVIVDYVNTTIDASNITVNFDETASIDAILTPAEAGNLTYKSDDESIATVDENGVVRGINVGSTNITVTFNGTYKYRNSTRTVKVTVMPTNSSVKAEDIEIPYGKTITIHVTSENATEIDYVISDKEGSIVKNGTVAPGEDITGFTLDIGVYDVNLTTVVSENHISANCLSKLIIDLEKSSIRADDVSAICGEAVVVKFESVNATQIYYRVLSDLGVVSSGLIYPDDSIVLYNLPLGNYTVNMTTIVDIDHKSANNISKIEVNLNLTAVNATDAVVVYGDGSYYSITVYGADGKPADNVTVVISGDISKTLTTENGVAKFRITQDPGTYSIAVTSLGVSEAKTIKVNRAAPNMVANSMTYKTKDKVKKYVLKLTTSKGYRIKNQQVTIKVNGKKYVAMTNHKGIATFKLNKLVKKAMYRAKIIYMGDKYSDSLVKKVKITVKG